MGHKKVTILKTIVQLKFCVPRPCPFHCTNVRVFILFYCMGNLTVKKPGVKTVQRALKERCGERVEEQRVKSYVRTAKLFPIPPH